MKKRPTKVSLRFIFLLFFIKLQTSYIDLFDKELFPFNDSLEECLQGIFKNMDIRTQEQIIKKVMLTHTLIYTDKKDYSFMCMELILGIMLFVYNEDVDFLKKSVDIQGFENVFATSKGKNKPAFSNFFKEKFYFFTIFASDITNTSIYNDDLGFTYHRFCDDYGGCYLAYQRFGCDCAEVKD